MIPSLQIPCQTHLSCLFRRMSSGFYLFPLHIVLCPRVPRAGCYRFFPLLVLCAPPPMMRFFLSPFRRIESGFSFLVVPPDVIRLLLIPAPHCPVPASSASGLLSLFSPPCPVCPTSAGAFLPVSFPPDYPALSFLVVPPD